MPKALSGISSSPIPYPNYYQSVGLRPAAPGNGNAIGNGNEFPRVCYELI